MVSCFTATTIITTTPPTIETVKKALFVSSEAVVASTATTTVTFSSRPSGEIMHCVTSLHTLFPRAILLTVRAMRVYLIIKKRQLISFGPAK